MVDYKVSVFDRVIAVQPVYFGNITGHGVCILIVQYKLTSFHENV